MQAKSKNIVIVGSGGAIGGALVERYAALPGVQTVFACSRDGRSFSSDKVQSIKLDYYDETSMIHAASALNDAGGVDLIVIATGVLHTDGVMPEKSLHDLTAHKFETIFKIDMVIPALLTKHFIDKLHLSQRAVMAILTARVGSITDNQLGGWYAYRCAKTALNMFIKNTAIELARKHKNQIIVGVHPGTVDSPLSKPFQAHLDPKKIFSPALAAEYVNQVVDTVQTGDSGKIFAWDGQEIAP